MKTSVIDVRAMLSALTARAVEQRIGKVPGVQSVTVNDAAGSATVRYDETLLEIADIKAAVHQSEYRSVGQSRPRQARNHQPARKLAILPTQQAAPVPSPAQRLRVLYFFLCAPPDSARSLRSAKFLQDNGRTGQVNPAIVWVINTSSRMSLMAIANVSQRSACGLPSALATAQAAIHLPEVQEMLRRLSEYKLGIFMPHMHDAKSGVFRPLRDDVMQVESGLEVSFRPAQEIANQTDRFLPVGWLWRAGVSTPVAACEMVWDEGAGSAERTIKHKMPGGNQ